jgi:hypothetical protein
MNHLATAPFDDHGFLLNYTAETAKWSEQDPVSQGQGMEGFARAILGDTRTGRPRQYHLGGVLAEGLHAPCRAHSAG